ncbi:MAG TPA: ATP-dependent helicase [Gammaproteobacteria bacterium]|nr:ATP-dependent helicase [Gammaproteobacteria bacterium]
MQPFQKLLERYNKLSISEQFILRVFSVIYEPVNQTTVNNILTALQKAATTFKASGTVLDQTLKQKLETRGLINIKAGKIKCEASIEEWLTHEAVMNGEFEIIMTIALNQVPLTLGDYFYSRSTYESARRLRYALHSRDDDLVFKLLQISDPYQKPKPEREQDLLAVCTNPLYTAWFAELHPAIQFQVLRPILESSAISWTDSRPFFDLLTSQMKSTQNSPSQVLQLHAEQCLVRGDWRSLEEDLAKLNTANGDMLGACLVFLRGDVQTAVSVFQTAQARIRKETRKKRMGIPGLAGVIYLLALLNDQSPGNSVLAEQQVNVIDKQKIPDLYNNAMWRLKVAREVNETKRTFDERVLQISYRYIDPLSYLLVGLSLYWNDISPDKAFLDRLKKNNETARISGYDWFAFQSDQLLAKFENKLPIPDEKWGRTFTEVLPRLENWERSLNALTQVVAPQMSPMSKKAEAEMRLAWFVENDLDYFSLQPKEQKRKKNGSWTAGRKVALKRLVEDQDSFGYLSDADRKICQSIREERDYSYYGPKHSYSLEGTGPLLAAIGHPYLFKHNEPGLRMEIQEGNPELIVSEQGHTIRLSLEPYPMHYEDGLVIEHVPGRLRIYRYTEELLNVAQILTNEGLQVPQSAKEKVLESVSSIAPLLTVHSDIAGMSPTTAEFVEPDTRLFIHLQPLSSGLRLSFHSQPFTIGPVLTPGQGGESIFAEIDGRQQHTRRDLNAETQKMESVLAACPTLYEVSPGEWRWEETDDALEGLLTLQSLGDDLVLNWPEGKQLKLSKSVGISQMSVSLRRKTDWFELDGELEVDTGQVYSMKVLMELIDSSTGRFIQLADGEFLTLTTELRSRLEDLNSVEHKGRVHALNARNLEESIDGMSIDADNAWQALQDRLRHAQDLDPQIPSTVQAELRDYQLQGFKWLARLDAWGAGACLADDMGLGKTLQALALMVDNANRGPSLVIAPTSVCTNWIEESVRFAPTLNPIRFGEFDRGKTLNHLQSYDILVCSYGLLQTEANALQAIHWNTIVADEAQAFKNATTKRSKAVMGLNADFKMIATGTPIENHLGELWNLFQFINPGLLGTRDVFNDKYAYPIENQKDLKSSAALRKLISPFILRRLKRDVLTELPPRTEITIRVEPNPEETALYEALRTEAVEQLSSKDLNPNQQRFQVLASITKLRRAVCNPNMIIKGANLPSAKLEAFAEILDELLENKHKALVFSQFVEHLSLIRGYLDRRGIDYQYLDGSTPVKKRKQAVDAFQAGEGELFLISLKAGGIGLNLTAADYVIHMDPWWNPAVEDQASDRAHRIGQMRPVTVYRLVVSNTIEEKIVKLHEQKRDLADNLLEGTEVSAKMSLNDMLDLLSQ